MTLSAAGWNQVMIAPVGAFFPKPGGGAPLLPRNARYAGRGATR
jgi:hypothetical protein